MVIWTYIVVIGWILITIWEITKVREHMKLVNLGIQAIKKQHKKKRRPINNLIFVDDEGNKEYHCAYCGKIIDEQEYDNEWYGYCDECTDDLMTEEEENVWGV